MRKVLPLCLLALVVSACQQDCSYEPPPTVSITPVYIRTNATGPAPPIQFIDQQDQILTEAGEVGGLVFFDGSFNGVQLPLDWRRNAISYYFIHQGDTNRINIRYAVNERYESAECGFVTEISELEIVSHDFVDARVNDQELQIFYME